jgi:hypothetical protein
MNVPSIAKLAPFLVVGLLQVSFAEAQTVGDMYKKCKFWELNGFPKKLEFNKSNLAALQCNQVFQSYRMSGKVNCQLSLNGFAGFVPPFDGYAFNASSNKELASSFLNWAEDNPRDWDKNVYAVLWKFTKRFRCDS